VIWTGKIWFASVSNDGAIEPVLVFPAAFSTSFRVPLSVFFLMFDNVSKFLIEQFPEDFATWLIGKPIALSELSPSELSLEPIRADALILLQSDDLVLHCEFQTAPDPTMPFRMADYRLRVYRRFPNKRMVQVVIYLRETESNLVRQTTFELDTLRHEFQVMRLWEQPIEPFLQLPGLLPYAALAQTTDRVSTLRQVAQAIENIGDRTDQSNLAAATGIMAGLVLNQETIRRVLRRELMQESVIYQELKEEARQEAKQSEVNLILRQLARRLNQAIPPGSMAQIQSLSFTQLEALGEALLEFTTLVDLEAWLATNPGEWSGDS
jgi:predicted transposase/invertase (TIGR01784 family)